MRRGFALTIIAMCIVGVISAMALYVYRNVNSKKMTQQNETRENLLMEGSAGYQIDKTKNAEIINIALLGIDSWDNLAGRSDAIVVMTLNYKNKTIKLSSFMRDLKVDIYGHGTSKLGHAYRYGGGELVMRTLKDNYGLEIDKYVAVNFSAFEKIIDLFGGLELEINLAERDEINRMTGGPELENTGAHLLNGEQILAYSRIRRVGSADFERTERQRRVVEELIKKLVALPLTEAYRLALEVENLLETNLDKQEAAHLFAGFDHLRENIEINHIRFPIEGTFRSEIISGDYYLISLDENETKELVRRHIHEDS